MNIKELFVESITDNKKLIIGLYALFIIVFVVSWIISTPKVQVTTSNITTLGSPGFETTALELFIQNELSGIVTYFASIFFGLLAILMVIYNAVNLALIGAMFASVMPNGGVLYILYLIPHGIFEITGMILQSAAGILLFLFIWRFIKAYRSHDTNSASLAFEETKKLLIQSIMLMVIGFILLLIAAPIEAYLSVSFSEFMIGLLGLK